MGELISQHKVQVVAVQRQQPKQLRKSLLLPQLSQQENCVCGQLIGGDVTDALPLRQYLLIYHIQRLQQDGRDLFLMPDRFRKGLFGDRQVISEYG